MKSFVIGSAGILVGFSLHALFGTRPLERQNGVPAQSVLAAPVATSATSARQRAADCPCMDAQTPRVASEEPRQEATLERAVAEAVRQPASAGAAGGGALHAAAALTERQKQAMEAHAELLSRAIQAGVWTEQDVVRMRTLMPHIAPEQRSDAYVAVSQAINRGQLKLEARHPF